MVSRYCWSCLAQLRPPRSLPFFSRVSLATPPVRGHSKTQKKNPSLVVSHYREAKTVKIKKKKREEYRPAVTPELKALRKRIVLSNTNALAVPDIPELSTENMGSAESQGQMLGLPGPLIDQLRALEAFKLTQNWNTFRRPATLMRRQNIDMGRLIQRQATEQKTVRRVLIGERGSGKSVMLLQAMAMALLKGWIVISISEAQDLVMGYTSYAPLPNTNPIQYVQKHNTAKLLSQTLRANLPILSSLSLSRPPPPSFPISLPPGTSLSRLAEIGINDPEMAWDSFNLLWAELTNPATPDQPRPPILLAIDSLAHLMTNSKYHSSGFEPIHAHDLSLVQHFLSHLSGERPLGPAGGIVLAATSESRTAPKVPSLNFALKQLLARQAQQSSIKLFSDPTGPKNKIPTPDPWKPLDSRVMQVLTGVPNGLVNETEARAERGPFRGVEVQQVQGLSREETRVMVEYFARSGLVREVVDEGFVANTWTMAGGGVVGEIERAVLRLRV